MGWDGDFSWSAWMRDEYHESMKGLYVVSATKNWLISLGFEEPLAQFLSLNNTQFDIILCYFDGELWDNGPTPHEVLQSYVTFKYDNWLLPTTERQKYLRALNDAIERLNTKKKRITGWQDIENILWVNPSALDSGILISLNYPMGVRL